MRKALVLVLCFILIMVICALPALAGGVGVNTAGVEHPGLKGQPWGNQMIGKALWQGFGKPFAFAGNFLDNLFRGNVEAAAKQAVLMPINAPLSVVADGATMVTGDTKVYGSPGNEIIQLK
jgi:hypothetical protein